MCSPVILVTKVLFLIHPIEEVLITDTTFFGSWIWIFNARHDTITVFFCWKQWLEFLLPLLGERNYCAHNIATTFYVRIGTNKLPKKQRFAKKYAPLWGEQKLAHNPFSVTNRGAKFQGFEV